MRQGDGTDLLGPSDPRSASIGVIYVAPNDDRQSVLTAILTQDKLGFKQVVVVLPDQNKAFQRPVDFDGLKNMRRGLKAEIVFIAPSGPGPAEFARQRRFPVYSSLDSFSQSIKLETIVSGTANGSTKRRLFGFGRKQEVAATVTVASVSGSRIGEESTSPLPVNEAVNAPRDESYSDLPDEDLDVAGEKNSSNGEEAKTIGMVGLAAGAGLATLANDQNSSSGIITFSSNAPRPKITRKFPVPPAEVVAVPIVASELSAQPNGTNPTTPVKRGNSGKMPAVGSSATAVGVGAAKAGSAASGGGGLPPSANAPGGPGGGGVGGTSRRTRILLAILLGVLTVLLIGGITIAAIPGGINNITHIIPGATTTATVTITPDSTVESIPFTINGVIGISKPDINKREVPASIITATSPTQSKTATSTGSIPGTQASGDLTFLNTSNSSKSFRSVILRGASGVPVSFNGPITVPAVPPASVTVTGFAVNIGSAGNIGPLDISGSCCATGITVKNGQFNRGRDPQPNSVVQQSDINGAANALTASLTPATQAALQKKVLPNEQVVPNTLVCNKSTFTANHAAGDRAPNVTVMVAITCTEEVYNQQAALTMAAVLLTTSQAVKDLGPNYKLTGNIVTAVTQVTPSPVGPKGTLLIIVSAMGVWVYQFSDTVQQNFKTQIQNKPEQDAINSLKAQPGVKDVKIEITNGSTSLPDAANIMIEIVAIPGATGPPTGNPTVAPTQQKAPTPTSTTGLGGS